jgi:hypothetical protein
MFVPDGMFISSGVPMAEISSSIISKSLRKVFPSLTIVEFLIRMLLIV